MSALRTMPRLACCMLLLALSSGAAWAAPSDRKAPTTPTDLRVTGVTAYSVSLAWNPSTDNSGQVRYKVCCADVNSEWVEGPASAAVYTAGIRPLRSYTLRIWAVDPAGNFSKPSNEVTFSTPADTTPPTTPRVSVTGIGPTHVALHFSAVDAGPLWYDVTMNGAPILNLLSSDSAIVPLLHPATSYTFTARARDFAGNLGVHEFAVAVPRAREVHRRLLDRGVLAGLALADAEPDDPALDDALLVCATEVTTSDEIALFAEALREELAGGAAGDGVAVAAGTGR